jgi:ADP-dependent NAD(P)H-hydrate dehydratase / NAD(P)H-hydrate epimerase
MLPVLTALEMSKADKAAIEDLRIGEVRLMELAGSEAAAIILKAIEKNDNPESCTFLVVCGKGNNGGDGFVVARHLLNRGATVDVVLLCSEETLKPVNREGYLILDAFSHYNEHLRIFHGIEDALCSVTETSYDVLIDGILGTGLRLTHSGETLQEPIGTAITLLNTLRMNSGALIAALDVPSGLDATTGLSASPAVIADLTITMAFLKTGFFFNEGPLHCGDLHTADISIPRFIAEPVSTLLTDREFAAEHFVMRNPSAAKHQNGKVLIIAGSMSSTASMIGAAMLAVKSALKTGAGYVCVSLPLMHAAAMHAFAPGAVVIGRDIEVIAEKARWADAVLIGCGLGRDSASVSFIADLLQRKEIAGNKLVIDADALYALASPDLASLSFYFSDALLTPHYGEMGRLSGVAVESIACNPLDSARTYAEKHQVNLLLKGNPTVIASPSDPVLLNTSGTDALGTAGSGDILSGMIAALAAKGATTFNAGAAAAWFHGRAGDLARTISSIVSAEDILEAIPSAIQEIFHIEE